MRSKKQKGLEKSEKSIKRPKGYSPEQILHNP